MHKTFTFPRFLLLLTALTVGSTPLRSAYACDICGVYTAVQGMKDLPGELQLKVSEQITNQNRAQHEGDKVSNNGESLTSSTTQIVARYATSEQLNFQFNLPYISRSYHQLDEQGMLRSGVEAGIGDASLLVGYSPVNHVTMNDTLLIGFQIGAKFPTGDSSRLAGEADEGDEDTSHMSDMNMSDMTHDMSVHPLHGGHTANGLVSAVHSHDLALGTGSVDGILGTTLYARTDNYFLSAIVQYFVRGEGEANYRMANALLWNIGPGIFLNATDEMSIAGKVAFSGEWKEDDVNSGSVETGTAVTGYFISPELSCTFGSNWYAELAVDLPLDIHNDETQLVTDSRIRIGLSKRF